MLRALHTIYSDKHLMLKVGFVVKGQIVLLCESSRCILKPESWQHAIEDLITNRSKWYMLTICGKTLISWMHLRILPTNSFINGSTVTSFVGRLNSLFSFVCSFWVSKVLKVVDWFKPWDLQSGNNNVLKKWEVHGNGLNFRVQHALQTGRPASTLKPQNCSILIFCSCTHVHQVLPTHLG